MMHCRVVGFPPVCASTMMERTSILPGVACIHIQKPMQMMMGKIYERKKSAGPAMRRLSSEVK